MTKKELCRRALRDWDKLVEIEFEAKNFTDMEQVLLEHNYAYKKLPSGEFEVETENALFTITKRVKPNGKIQPKLDDRFVINGIGITSFALACKMRGACNHFIVELQNTDDLTDISFYEIETTRTLKQFENEYKRLRNKWFKGCETLPTLIEYLESELLELGFGLYQITSDLVLDF